MGRNPPFYVPFCWLRCAQERKVITDKTRENEVYSLLKYYPKPYGKKHISYVFLINFLKISLSLGSLLVNLIVAINSSGTVSRPIYSLSKLELPRVSKGECSVLCYLITLKLFNSYFYALFSKDVGMYDWGLINCKEFSRGNQGVSEILH